MENVEKWKFWFIVKYFIRNLFSTYYLHIYLISCFHNQHSYFAAYTPLRLMFYKTDMRNLWQTHFKRKYEKLMNYLFKMKEMNEIVLGKGLFSSKKGNFVWQKGTWIVKKGRWRLNTPLIGSCLWDFWFKLRKSFFFKKGTFSKGSDPQMLHFSKIGPGSAKNYTMYLRVI